ncbi:MAG TPA: hypothetical protein VLI71_05280, partial [Gammaproteobacteria bacterium]|nr:hypothetical protein [Gammaproteobacteria bacterium]
RARVDTMAERFDGRFNEARQYTDKRFEELRDRIDGVERSLASAKVWALMLFIAQAAAVYGTLARTMGWI